MPAAVQRNAIAAFRHRFTLRQTRRTVPIMFSIELVQASERLSFIGKPRRLTVSISSSPSSPACLAAILVSVFLTIRNEASAARSFTRAIAAQKSGFLAGEITPAYAILDEDVLRRMQRVNPKVKIIFV